MTQIERVTSESWNSLEKLFRGSAECSECWCMNHRSRPSFCPTGEAARVALHKALADGEAFGLLATVDGAAAGWCAVDPVSTQVGHDYCMQLKVGKPSQAWMIHCLYIAPEFRARGLSRELISAAVDLAREQGALEILAFPIPEESSGKFPQDVAEFSGRLSTFLRLGFMPQEKLGEFYQVVSKRL